MQVSVIICTYNSIWEKLNKTVKMVLKQKNISFEIIIADDGSSYVYTEQLKILFEKENFTDYKFVLNKENKGTVRNVISGLQKSEGEYVFLTSPGDILFDDLTLCDFYNYAKKNAVKCLFGNAVYYSGDKDEIIIHNIVNRPDNPDIFDINKSKICGKIALFNGMKILGATYFREREFAIKYINGISKTAKYTEDSTSSLLSVVCDEKITYFNRNIVWYEYGSGISTKGNDKWSLILKNELNKTKTYLLEKYPKDKVMDYMRIKDNNRSKIASLIICGVKHPFILIKDIAIRGYPKKISDGNAEDLKSILANLE